MCGIAAFSLSSDSKLNARELAHNLLSAIEARGSHASGFAYAMADGSTGYYKQPRPGSQLPLGDLPRDARTVILHTRFATQGAIEDNRNNHPVMSPEGNIALVHNGVISNDHLLRGDLGLTRAIHGEVDSLVLPALIEQGDVDSLALAAGYAAIAWIDSRQPSLLQIARLKSSPVAYTHLIDGSFVMASTPGLLESALLDTPTIYGGVFEMAERTMMTVTGGWIIEADKSPLMTYNHSAYTRFSGATSGGHGQPKVVTTPPKAVTQIPTVGSEDSCPSGVSAETESYFEDLEEWRRKRDEEEGNGPRGYYTEDGWTPFMPDDQYDDDAFDYDYDDDNDWDDAALALMGLPRGSGFYILDNDGDTSHYPTLDDLESRLKWLCKMTASGNDIFPSATSQEYWANHVRDLGAVDEDGMLVSWVDDMAEIDEWESPAVRNLDYIRGGIGYLMTIKGA